MIHTDKIAGAVYGLALGDALGRPTEFMSLKKIIHTYGATGYMPLPKDGKFTDDTQMTLAVGRALMTARSRVPRELVRTITNEFIRWQRVDPPRAPGVSCMTAIRGLTRTRRQHLPWTTGTTLSLGCGANMRVVPTALLKNAHEAVVTTQLQAALTHGHSRAIAAAELTAWAVRYAALGADITDLPEMLYHRARSQRGVYHRGWLRRLDSRWALPGEDMMVVAWEHMMHVMRRVSATLALRRQPQDVCGALGASWVADEALATGLYFAVKYAHDPVLAISMAARTNGDSDSIACIAGAIVGAHVGEAAAWPALWTMRIERQAELEQLIHFLSNDQK